MNYEELCEVIVNLTQNERDVLDIICQKKNNTGVFRVHIQVVTCSTEVETKETLERLLSLALLQVGVLKFDDVGFVYFEIDVRGNVYRIRPDLYKILYGE